MLIATVTGRSKAVKCGFQVWFCCQDEGYKGYESYVTAPYVSGEYTCRYFIIMFYVLISYPLLLSEIMSRAT